MAETIRHIDGDQWEKEMLALLGRRYSPGEFFEVPADDKGDLGMDAVGRDGVVYQFYSPDEPLSNDELKKKHQKKVYNDLRKLVEKKEEHERVLGNITVRRWMLLVPRMKSKEVLAYANKRAEVVRSAKCSYIAHDFKAVVSTDVFLGIERKQLVNGVLTKLKLDVPEPSTAQLADWKQSHEGDELLETLESKLRKIPALSTEKKVAEESKGYLIRFLRGQDLLSKLQEGHPSMWEGVTSVKRAFELILVVRSNTSVDTADQRILRELEEYESRLTSDFQSDLGIENINQLVLEAVSDWLMRCPLDFQENQR